MGEAGLEMEEAELNLLKRMKVGELEPLLQKELIEIATGLSGECTLTKASSVHAFYRMYAEEKAKEKKNRRMLRKAEEMISRLASLNLHHDAQQSLNRRQAIQQREASRRREERGRKVPLTPLPAAIMISARMRSLFESIGITHTRDMEQAVGVLGEEKAAERIGMVHAMTIAESLVKKVFAEHPETIRIPRDADFYYELESIEAKKALLDTQKSAGKGPLPPWADYDITPGILVDDYHHISRLLSIPVPAEAPQEAEEKKPRYTGRPMKIGEMKATLSVLGWEFVRFTGELHFQKPYVDEDRVKKFRTVTISKPHDGEYNPVTVRKIINNISVTPSEFEEARRKARGEI
jgi:hypothetical protein